MKMKQVFLIILLSSASAFGSVALYNKLFEKTTKLNMSED